MGYMLAVVLTLGGYLAGLHWLLTPPDPWQLGPKSPQSIGAKKRLPVMPPAEAGAAAELAASSKPDTKLASVETSSVATNENQTAHPTAIRLEATPPIAEPAHILRREMSATKTRRDNRRRAERHTSRKLVLMVLRTYQRSDGRRFTRLLPLSAARNTPAFRPEQPW
jgi:hypothetical protein